MARRYTVMKPFDGDRRYVPGEVVDTTDWPTDNLHSLIRTKYLEVYVPTPDGVASSLEELGEADGADAETVTTLLDAVRSLHAQNAELADKVAKLEELTAPMPGVEFIEGEVGELAMFDGAHLTARIDRLEQELGLEPLPPTENAFDGEEQGAPAVVTDPEENPDQPATDDEAAAKSEGGPATDAKAETPTPPVEPSPEAVDASPTGSRKTTRAK